MNVFNRIIELSVLTKDILDAVSITISLPKRRPIDGEGLKNELMKLYRYLVMKAVSNIGEKSRTSIKIDFKNTGVNLLIHVSIHPYMTMFFIVYPSITITSDRVVLKPIVKGYTVKYKPTYMAT